MAYADTLKVFESLEAGDRIRLKHEVKVGFRSWHTETVGTVVTAERRRHSLHFNRNYDDKVYSDVIVLKLPNDELTTVTLDEFSELEKLAPETAASATAPPEEASPEES